MSETNKQNGNNQPGCTGYFVSFIFGVVSAVAAPFVFQKAIESGDERAIREEELMGAWADYANPCPTECRLVPDGQQTCETVRSKLKQEYPNEEFREVDLCEPYNESAVIAGQVAYADTLPWDEREAELSRIDEEARLREIDRNGGRLIESNGRIEPEYPGYF
jgi:hypothetical protein